MSSFITKFREVVPEMFFFPAITYKPEDYPDLTGKVYIVTGSSSGLGLFAARELLLKGAKVYLLARTESKLQSATKALIEQDKIPEERVQSILVDYADLSTIKPAVNTFLAKETRLDGLVHNAGVNSSRAGKTVQGHNWAIGINGFAPFVVQSLLDDILIKTANKSPKNSVRTVWVSSSAHWLAPPHGGIDTDDVENTKGVSGTMANYGISKTYNIYEAALWAKHHAESGVVSVSVHPGVVETDIDRDQPGYRNFITYFLRNPLEKGGYTILYPIVSPNVTVEDNGSYYKPFGVKGIIRADIKEGFEGDKGEKVQKLLQNIAKDFV